MQRAVLGWGDGYKLGVKCSLLPQSITNDFLSWKKCRAQKAVRAYRASVQIMGGKVLT